MAQTQAAAAHEAPRPSAAAAAAAGGGAAANSSAAGAGAGASAGAVKEQNLIVNLTFNPPLVNILGPVRDATIAKLTAVLPEVCTSTQTSTARHTFAFVRRERPPCWSGQLTSSFANEEVGQSRVILSILDALEEEGDWKLKGSNATCHDVDKVTYKFFFVRKI